MSERGGRATAVGVLPSTARASVALPSATAEVQSFELRPGDEQEGWLEVDASGICGTDVALFARGVSAPTVLGHHVVGRVASLGEDAAGRRRLQPGDRVVLEEYLPCGHCPTCATGPYRLCPQTDVWGSGRRIGTLPVAESALSGGNGEYVFLPANAVTHRLPDGLDGKLAAWVLPFANAVDWIGEAAAVRPGDTVVVMGPGYHGIAVAAAARRAGASRVIVTGLRRDAERLAICEALGATPVVVDEPDTTARRLEDVAGGRDVDAVVDTVGSEPAVLGPALDVLGHGGRLVLTHPKTPREVGLDTGMLVRLNLRVSGVRGRSPEAIAAAIDALTAGDSGLEQVPTVEIGLDETGDMLARLAAGTGPESPHVVVRPGL